MSAPHAGVDPFSDSEDESRHSTSVVPTDSYSICKCLHNVAKWACETVSQKYVRSTVGTRLSGRSKNSKILGWHKNPFKCL